MPKPATLDEARAVLAAEPVEVVLLDLHVGNERGVDLLRELRPRPARGGGGAAHGQPARADFVRGRGRADAVISKPFAVEELGETVSRLAGPFGRV